MAKPSSTCCSPRVAALEQHDLDVSVERPILRLGETQVELQADIVGLGGSPRAAAQLVLAGRQQGGPGGHGFVFGSDAHPGPVTFEGMGSATTLNDRPPPFGLAQQPIVEPET